MSADVLRGPPARVDRLDFSESLQDRRVQVSRLRWLASLLLAPLVAVPILWVGQDPVERIATLDAISVSEPPLVEMPLQMNPQVERWVDAFQTARRPEFEDLLRRRTLYAEMIQGKLREREMPQELLYISVIESGLSPHAVSHVSAVGLWQFMSPTALQYGLRVDEYVDERRDPVRATDAALDYLAYLHARFGGSWYLAAAAFNAGPGRLERVLVRHAGGLPVSGDDDLYWEVVEHLPRETREYVPKMVAVSMLANDADELGFDSSGHEPYRFDNVFVPGGTTLESVADALEIHVRALRDLNPHLMRGITPPGEIYGVRIPIGESATVVNALAETIPLRKTDDD